MSKTALVIVDIQNDYFENGDLELVNPIGASKNAGKILECFRNKNLPFVHVQHLSAEKESPVFAVESEGVKIHDNVKSLEVEKIGSKILPEQFQRNRSFTILK